MRSRRDNILTKDKLYSYVKAWRAVALRLSLPIASSLVNSARGVVDGQTQPLRQRHPGGG